MSIIEEKSFDIRYTRLEDGAFLKKWLLEKGMLDHFSMDGEKEVDEMLKIWLGFSRYKSSLTACYKGVPCGIATLFLMPYIKLVHHSLVYLVVDPQMQRKKVGTSLLKNIEHLGKNYFRFEKLGFEVFGDGEIKHLLEKHEYKKIYSQKRYVKCGENSYKDRSYYEKKFIAGKKDDA
ncbi:MAG: hypothetical protein S4CHLAM37_10490 [Chlamydiia bacterium]|nr:hypothetical protein [Chlamydiia bacterium]